VASEVLPSVMDSSVLSCWLAAQQHHHCLQLICLCLLCHCCLQDATISAAAAKFTLALAPALFMDAADQCCR
jgi:hypothetical protein